MIYVFGILHRGSYKVTSKHYGYDKHLPVFTDYATSHLLVVVQHLICTSRWSTEDDETGMDVKQYIPVIH